MERNVEIPIRIPMSSNIMGMPTGINSYRIWSIGPVSKFDRSNEGVVNKNIFLSPFCDP